VPAVAVIQEEQMVFIIIGRKGYVGCFFIIYNNHKNLFRLFYIQIKLELFKKILEFLK